ncbi:hypothetical protein [Microlunatus soli]|uniref:Uncharacterized protein n=1 Tax=Microlunatus soli TaxID=630515 RepID=A0A1H1N474_9ACTN|nr:hypothetical protein [Microlunatus soli]SDR93525.1 hypothetical protein SAMN04489812_0364 [Microlunatus soli]
MSLSPQQVVASFDSASVLHASTAAALRGTPFSNLGNPEAVGRLVRVATRLPWPILREIYRRVGGAEGIRPEQLSDVDLGAVAASFADGYPRRRYPAAFIGSSNGALTQLAAAMQVPWLPQTVLVPVHRLGDPERPDQALEFGRRWGPELLGGNPDVTLHQMHDAAQDRLMTARMAYFRVKWRRLPDAFARFLDDQLLPGAPVLLVDDQIRWPVTRVAERHWFQTGGLGGLSAQDHLSGPHAPTADAEAPEAEWGADPDYIASIRDWCAAHGHPVILIRYRGPQQAAHPVAAVLRDWMRTRGEPADELIVPSFILGDPWRVLNHALVPFWTYFPVRDALDSLDRHLQRSSRYRSVYVLGFQHGVRSPGVAMPEDFVSTIERHGAAAELLAVRAQDWPHDIGSMARYGAALDALPAAGQPWLPVDVWAAARALRKTPGEDGHPLVADVPDSTAAPSDAASTRAGDNRWLA